MENRGDGGDGFRIMKKNSNNSDCFVWLYPFLKETYITMVKIQENDRYQWINWGFSIYISGILSHI